MTKNRDGILRPARLAMRLSLSIYSLAPVEPPGAEKYLTYHPPLIAMLTVRDMGSSLKIRRRDLYFPNTHLVKQAPEQLAVFRAVAEYGENSPTIVPAANQSV